MTIASEDNAENHGSMMDREDEFVEDDLITTRNELEEVEEFTEYENEEVDEADAEIDHEEMETRNEMEQETEEIPTCLLTLMMYSYRYS